MTKQLWIMIAGPYTSGASSSAERAFNQRALNEAALAVFERGHVPVVGVNLALPIIEAAGSDRFEEIMIPLSLKLAARCDAVLRIGGPSSGAEQEAQRIKDRGGRVFKSLAEIPIVKG